MVIGSLVPKERPLKPFFLLQGNQKFITVNCNVGYHFCDTVLEVFSS